ncbi:MAG: ArnT family glycosyltransferase [Candidatus Hodarchaeota archaeon]
MNPKNNIPQFFIQIRQKYLFFLLLNRELIFLTIFALVLRFIAFLFLYDWIDDGFTWIFFSKNIHNDLFFQTPRNFVFLPLFAYVGALFILLTDLIGLELLKSLQFLNMLLGTITVTLTYITAKKVTPNRRVPLLSGLLVATNPIHVIYSVSSLTEILFGVFLLLAVLFYINMDNHQYSLFFSGLCFSLACLTRYESWALIPFLIPYFFYHRNKIGERWVQIIWAACIGLIGIILWFLREAIVFDNPWLPLEHYLGGKGASGGIETANNVFIDAFYFPIKLIIITINAGFFPLFLFPFLLYYYKNIRNSAVITLYVLFASFMSVLCLSFILGGNSGWDRYLLPIIPETMILSSLTIVVLLENFLTHIHLNFPSKLHDIKKASSLILGIFIFYYLATGGIIITLYAPEFNFDRDREAIEAGRFLAKNYTEGTIICDLPPLLVASELDTSLFYDSLNFFTLETKSGTINQRLQSLEVKYVVWTNVDYSHLEDYLPFLNATTPDDLVYEGTLFKNIYRTERVPKHAFADIFEIVYL